MRRCVVFLMTLSLIFGAVTSQAWGSSAKVTGCASSPPLASPTTVSNAASSAADSIESEIERMARALRTGQNQIISTLDSAFETQNTVLHQLLTSLEENRQKMINARTFGPRSEAYGSNIEGGSLVKVLQGINVEEGLSSNFREAIDDYIRGFDGNHERLAYYSLVDLDDFDSTFFFPGNNVLNTNQQEQALFALRSIIDPFPNPELPSNFNGDDLGYESLRKAKYSRLVMPTSVLSEITSSYMPTIELDEWSKDLYARMGGEGDPPQLNDGKLSVMGYIDLMVKSRFANQDWFAGDEGIHGKTESGILKEIAVMQALQTEMQRRQMRHMQQTAGLLAQGQASDNREFDQALREMYRKVLRQ